MLADSRFEAVRVKAARSPVHDIELETSPDSLVQVMEVESGS